MKKILLCVTGSVAAYKALELTRLLTKENYEVKVILTKAAQEFVTRLSFEALCQHRVYDDLFRYTDNPIEHIELARWADQIVIAPASANTIGKLAAGLAGDLLGNVVLATDKPVYIAPAMNKLMWQNSIVRENLAKLKDRGCVVLPPDSGEQACGDVGEGRLMEPEAIVKNIFHAIAEIDKTVLITAGPTVERLDPVRYISNHSSGKMGYALAQSFVHLGWRVILISGPTQLQAPKGITLIRVKSADDMYKAVHQYIVDADIFIAAAAVADYRPETYVEKKIKKKEGEELLSIKLVRNEDILKSVSSLRHHRPLCVGFAAETHNAKENALSKISSKALDFLVLNQIDNETGFPFYSEQNQVQVYDHLHQLVLDLARMSKKEIAQEIAKLLNRQILKKEIQTELSYE